MNADSSVREAIIFLGAMLLVIGLYHRIQSQRTGERLDRTKEGWPILIALRLLGLSAIFLAVASFWNPDWLRWSYLSLALAVRWTSVLVFAAAVAWLIWMFRTLGRNITDTVVVRKDAHFVDNGPYRFVRNPMYTGVLTLGISFGLAMETWIVPVFTALAFSLFVLRTPIEERYLVDRFGSRYIDYMGRVGRFLPKVS